jgi:hypothetical protein
MTGKKSTYSRSVHTCATVEAVEPARRSGSAGDFPRARGSQDDLAEVEMVEWLEHPAEMAMPPEEIERLTCFVVRTDADERQVFYLLRFRHPEFPEEHPGDWFVGVAGPYP